MEHPLEEYCSTEHQKNLVRLRYVEGCSWNEISKGVGSDRTNIRSSLRVVEGRAAKAGYAPKHDHVHTVPPGYAVKGSSTLYKDGNVALQWVKTEADKQAQFDAMISRIELACEGIKPWKPVKQPKQVEENLLSLLVITDFHLGSYCWGDETSEDYNTDMARDLFLSSIKEMIDSTPKSKSGYFVISVTSCIGTDCSKSPPLPPISSIMTVGTAVSSI